MKTVSICSSFYESGRPYLHAYMESVIKAVKAANCRAQVILSIDDLADPEGSVSRYSHDLGFVFTSSHQGASFTAVRNALFEKACSVGADNLIFLDMDDVMDEAGISLHLECLAKADISYGDMWNIDAKGAPLPGSLYLGASIPDFVDSIDAILSRNFFGLSNTAVRRTALAGLGTFVPEHLVATDWWLYSVLILGGCRAMKTTAPVSSYRQYQANIFGSHGASDMAALKKRCKIIREHYSALPEIKGIKALEAQVIKLEAAINQNQPGLDQLIEEAFQAPGAWFEDVFTIANRLELKP